MWTLFAISILWTRVNDLSHRPHLKSGPFSPEIRSSQCSNMASTQERQQKLKLFPLNIIKHYKSFRKCGYLLLQHAVERTVLWNYVWNAWLSVNICKPQLLQSLKSRVSQQSDCFTYQTISVPENSRKSFYQFFYLMFYLAFVQFNKTQ